MALPSEVWDGVLRRLRMILPAFAVETWLAPLQMQMEGGAVRLLCPSSFHRDRIQAHYLPRIVEAARAELARDVAVRLDTRAHGARPLAKPPAPSRDAATAERSAPAGTRAPASPSPLRASPDAVPSPARGAREGTAARAQPALPYTFENFVVGPCNALAREASLAIARRRQHGLQQLYVAAAPGLGKTHLSRAAAAEAERVAPGSSIYVSAEAFTNDFLSAMRGGRMRNFQDRFRRRCEVLVVEDVHFLERKRATQLELFHTVQHVLGVGGRVLLTGDRPPQALTGLDARLRSQLAGGFFAELEPPDATVRRNIFRAKAAAGGVHLPPECLELLVEVLEGSVRDLEGVLIQLVTTASLLKKKIDLPLAQEVLRKRSTAVALTKVRPDPMTVIRTVAGFFQTTPERMAARSRRRDVLVPRQLAIYLCHRYTDASLTEIGRALGRELPAVKNAIARVERAMLERAPLRYQVEALVQRIEELDGAMGG